MIIVIYKVKQFIKKVNFIIWVRLNGNFNIVFYSSLSIGPQDTFGLYLQIKLKRIECVKKIESLILIRCNRKKSDVFQFIIFFNERSFLYIK